MMRYLLLILLFWGCTRDDCVMVQRIVHVEAQIPTIDVVDSFYSCMPDTIKDGYISNKIGRVTTTYVYLK